MRPLLRRAAMLSLAAVSLACADRGPVTPAANNGPLVVPRADVAALAAPDVRFNELHYDNSGTDVGESIEVAGPAGTDLTGWSVVLYNGNGGAVYNTQALSGAIPATCGARGVVVLAYPSNGIQNGGTGTNTDSPDGMALVNASGTVVEFLSYEGTFVAVGGAADGMLSTDIGVRELGEPVGQSLQRSDGGVAWVGPQAATFGACNDVADPAPVTVARVEAAPAEATIAVGGTQAFAATAYDAADVAVPGAAVVWTSLAPSIATVSDAGLASGVSAGDASLVATVGTVADTVTLHVQTTTPPVLPPVHFSELHYDNFGTDADEAIEVEGLAGTDLTGWTVVLYNGNGGAPYDTKTLSGAIPATCDMKGVVVVTYPSNGIQNGSPDGMALVNASGTVIEFLSYEGTFTAVGGAADGMLSVDIGVEQSSAPVGTTLLRDPITGTWASGPRSIGACNTNDGGPPPTTGGAISFSGRLPSDPALPVGYQDQLFATVRDASNAVVTVPVTWTSETPAIASIDADGVMTALAPGSATVRATATLEGGATVTSTYTLPTTIATPSATAQYAGNTEFGIPTDGTPADDYIVVNPQYTSSFSNVRNTPNWVSYDLDATHFGPQDRCDCFTYDPTLPSSFTRYTTADYTGAGAIAGYGIDRGHLARSFDRTTGSLDNARTFLFSNIIPQAADLNQGPWAAMENDLGNLARTQNKEVYIVAGVAGSKGTVKNEGLITIPAQVWKVAVILPRDAGLSSVHTTADLQVIAALFPNDAGIRNVDWHTYETTVDAVEALSGYDLLALLPDAIELVVESGSRPPVAPMLGAATGSEGSSVTFSAAGATDPDGDALTYAWTFGDGATASGLSTAHTYAQDGAYDVRLIVSDPFGLADTATTTATIANVAPSIGAFAGATLIAGETYSASCSFTDPGADPWTGAVTWGDGSGGALALNGMSFTLSHAYATAGSYTVTVRISDDDVTSSRSATVTVLSRAQAAQRAVALVNDLLADGALNAGVATSLRSKLTNAGRMFEAGKPTPAVNMLEAALHELDAMARSGRADLSDLRVLISRIVAVG